MDKKKANIAYKIVWWVLLVMAIVLTVILSHRFVMSIWACMLANSFSLLFSVNGIILLALDIVEIVLLFVFYGKAFQKCSGGKIHQPKHIIALKIIWIILLIFVVVAMPAGIALLRAGTFGVAGAILIMLSLLVFMGLVFLFTKAFEPELTEMRLKKDLYTQKRTEQIQEEIASTDADIQHRAIKKKTRSVVEGIKIEKCPKCGDTVEADEEYCNKCGTHLIKKCNNCKTVNGANDKFCKKCGQNLED